MLIDKFDKERQRFELELRYVNALGGFYAFTYNNKSITSKTPEGLWKRIKNKLKEENDAKTIEP